MGLVDLVRRWMPREEKRESISCWIFPEAVVGREFSGVLELQEAIAAFGKEIKDACTQVYGQPAEQKKTTESRVHYTWQTTERKIEYIVNIGEKERRKSAYNAILIIEQNDETIDREKAGRFLQQILQYGVLASGIEPGSYMISRTRAGRTESAYAETVQEIGISITRSCDFREDKGWVYSKKAA